MAEAQDRDQTTPVTIPGRGVTPEAQPAEPPAPARVMCINAHPDDQEFSVGGTLAKWARAGSEIITVCVTSGESGSNRWTPPSMTRETLIPIREDEQQRAARVLGVKEVIFLHYPDGGLVPSLELRRELTRLIRKHRPAAVICTDPTMRYYGRNYLNHPDHRVTGDVALDAVFPSAGTKFIFPELLDEGLEPHEVVQVFLSGAENPDTFIDISGTMATKLAALREHHSQLGEWDPAEMLVNWARQQGEPRGMEAAETFRVMFLVEPPAST